MIKISLETNKKGDINFRANIAEKLKNNVILKRALFESKIIKSNKSYSYLIPMRFFLPIINNLGKDNIKIDEKSIDGFLEFSDFYEENTYYTGKATAIYMKKWREEGCPKIFKVEVNKETLEVKKIVAFERLI